MCFVWICGILGGHQLVWAGVLSHIAAVDPLHAVHRILLQQVPAWQEGGASLPVHVRGVPRAGDLNRTQCVLPCQPADLRTVISPTAVSLQPTEDSMPSFVRHFGVITAMGLLLHQVTLIYSHRTKTPPKRILVKLSVKSSMRSMNKL